TRTALGEPAQAPTPTSGAGTTISELPGSGGARTAALDSSSIIPAQYATFPQAVAHLAKTGKGTLSNRARNSTNPTGNLGLKPLPSLRQRPPRRLADLRILRIKLHQRVHDHRRRADPREPLMVGRDHVPRRPGRAGMAEHLGKRPLVVVP